MVVKLNAGKLLLLLPLVLFVGGVVFLWQSLESPSQRLLPSPLIGKVAPKLELPLLKQPQQIFTTKQMLGKVWLLNFWASWCTGCRQEHQILQTLKNQHKQIIVGVNFKDKTEDALNFLQQLGNPYIFSVVDSSGETSIDWGYYGLPETYIINQSGVVVYKHVGVIKQTTLVQEILPLLTSLQQ